MQQEKNLQLLSDMLEKLDTKSQVDEMVQIFQLVVEISKQTKDLTEKELANLRDMFDNAVSEMKSGNVEQMSSMKSRLMSYCETEMSNMMKMREKDIKDIKEMIPKEKDLTYLENKLADVEAKILPFPEPKEITSYEVRDKLESIKEESEKLDKSAIRGLDEIEKLARQTKGTTSIFGGRGIQLYLDGAKKGLAQTLNIIPGTGVSFTYSTAYGRNDLTINAQAASSSILDATGTIDDTNTAFTFLSEPSYLVINGASYRKTGGAITWTFLALTATLSAPVGVGGSIYGVR